MDNGFYVFDKNNDFVIHVEDHPYLADHSRVSIIDIRWKLIDVIDCKSCDLDSDNILKTLYWIDIPNPIKLKKLRTNITKLTNINYYT